MTEPSKPPAGERLRAFRSEWRDRIESALCSFLPDPGAEPRRLHEAMHYAMFPGGKRLRPLLVLLASQATGGDMARALPAAAAVEFLHTYSLVHDDLPCMDDDALRRGRPTCHVAFDEATAVLVGDALLTLAFAAVSEGGAAAAKALAHAAGSLGMVGGQAADMAAEHSRLTRSNALDMVEWIHDHKTGALITACLEVGALAGDGPGVVPSLPSLREYGKALGRAFQIADDCLDLTADAEALGKEPGMDVAAEKLTYPAVLGLADSEAEARRLAERAGELSRSICSWPEKDGQKASALDAECLLLQDVAAYSVARGF